MLLSHSRFGFSTVLAGGIAVEAAKLSEPPSHCSQRPLGSATGDRAWLLTPPIGSHRPSGGACPEMLLTASTQGWPTHNGSGLVPDAKVSASPIASWHGTPLA